MLCTIYILKGIDSTEKPFNYECTASHRLRKRERTCAKFEFGFAVSMGFDIAHTASRNSVAMLQRNLAHKWGALKCKSATFCKVNFFFAAFFFSAEYFHNKPLVLYSWNLKAIIYSILNQFSQFSAAGPTRLAHQECASAFVFLDLHIQPRQHGACTWGQIHASMLQPRETVVSFSNYENTLFGVE